MPFPPDEGLNLDAAFAESERLTRRNSKTFFTATGLLPEAARRAIRALYGFCRSTDDLVDHDGATLADVEAWRARVALPATVQPDAALRAWAFIREQYGVNARYEAELISGVALDIAKHRYANWPELERYCYLVASTVGLMSLPIIGLAEGVTFEDAAPYAIKLGVALQLTNILRDVGEDAARGRVYLPTTDLARFHLIAEDLLNGVHDQRFVELIKFEIRRARDLYCRALPGIALLSPAARPAVAAAALLYRAILDEIDAIDYRVYTQRAHTSGLQKLLRLPGIAWTVWTLQPPQVTTDGWRVSET
ncbi:MAG: phytoene/squalene synthase family protein [Anaerolineales bacterium]